MVRKRVTFCFMMCRLLLVPPLDASMTNSRSHRRGSLYARPPPLAPSDTYWPGRDRKYFDLSASQLPLTESLHDCMLRTAPIWESKILKELKQGRNVMVVGHANTLRGLVKTIDGKSRYFFLAIV